MTKPNRAERRRQMRAAGFRRAEGKRGRRGATRVAEAPAPRREALPALERAGLLVPNGLWTPGSK